MIDELKKFRKKKPKNHRGFPGKSVKIADAGTASLLANQMSAWGIPADICIL